MMTAIEITDVRFPSPGPVAGSAEGSGESLSSAAPWALSGTLFQAAGAVQEQPAAPVSTSPLILMSSAAGVPQTYYANFARYLVEQGARAVLTYDYRGMSASAGSRSRWPELRMFHWAQHDFPAAAAFLKSVAPQHPLMGVGHSFGGQALGLSGASNMFERYATVATMSGYWRALDTPYAVLFQTQVVARSLVAVLGYVPKGWGVGEAFPGPIMRDWIRWIKHPAYWFEQSDVPGLENFAKVTLPFLSVGVKDDPWGTPKAIANFMQHYSNADFRQVWVEPAESGKIGHLGFFRQRHRDTHWPIVRDHIFQTSADGRA